MHPLALHKFLAGSIAPTLRYCPLCLAEHTPASYSLLWRFLVLPGCSEHSRPLPRSVWSLRVPSCSAEVSPSTHDLSYLSRGPEKRRPLSSEQRGLKIYTPVHHRPENAPHTGASTPGERPGETHGKTLSIPPAKARPLDTRGGVFDGSRDLYRPAYRLGERSRVKPACLDDYMRYADILGCSLCEVFDETALQDLLVSASEEQLLEQVEQAIH